MARRLVLDANTSWSGPFSGSALARIEQRDPDDWPILATALALECPIWTEDNDFFGAGVPTWTTDRVELYLNSADRSRTLMAASMRPAAAVRVRPSAVDHRCA